MIKRWPVIDTCFTIGVSPTVHFFAEEELIPLMDRNNIDIQIVYQPDESYHHQTPDWNQYLGNDYIAKVQKLFQGRILGLATIQLWHQANSLPYSMVKRNIALEELDRSILDLGLHGLRMNPIQHNYQFNNRVIVWPVLRRLTELQVLTGRRLIVSVHAYGDSLNNSPEAVAETAREFPDLIFLMQHTGFVWGYGTVCDVAANVQNIIMDISTMPQKEVIYQVYKRHGAQKFCIGTDGPFSSYKVKMAILKDFCENTEEEELVLGGNIARLLGIARKDAEV